MTSEFPLSSRVTLFGLVKAAELNGKSGVVKSGVTNGRQRVYIEALSKEVALKLSNMKYEERSVESFSAKELKAILKAKSVSDSELTGIDKSELQTKVKELDEANNPQELAKLLATAQAPRAKPAASAPMEKRLIWSK